MVGESLHSKNFRELNSCWRMAADKRHDLAGWRARPKDTGDARRFERRNIALRNNAAGKDRHIGHVTLAQQSHHTRQQ